MTTTPQPEPVRRRLRTPLLVLLALVVIDVGVRATADTWERHSPDDYAARLSGCRREPRDFVLVGGSPVSEGLDPDVVAGFRWRGEPLTNGYALGLPGATTSEVYHAVVHGCPTPPKLLVYGITASDINDARNEPHGPASLMAWADLPTWYAARPKSAEWVTRHFLQARAGRAWAAYRYRHGMRMAAALAADAAFPGCCPDAAREAAELRDYADALGAGRGYAPAAGFAERRWDEVKRVNAEVPPFGFLDKYRTGSHLNYLHRLLDWADTNGTAVVMLDVPTTADLDAKYPEAFAEYRRRLAEVETARRVTVIRAHRDAVGLDDTLFADLIHLNRAGARKFSAWLRERLNEAGSSAGPAAHAHLTAGGRP